MSTWAEERKKGSVQKGAVLGGPVRPEDYKLGEWKDGGRDDRTEDGSAGGVRQSTLNELGGPLLFGFHVSQFKFQGRYWRGNGCTKAMVTPLFPLFLGIFIVGRYRCPNYPIQ